ncbi:PAS domain-containing protein [Brevundimonas sp.]|uniref:PAS domain-containing protein n=1 Tax=Brevundimonas sp. TaxID=1871086 RepID=UPI002737D6C0|nr:PAS domain-containing protein [Brevundimonas sp.]MDP3802906.1 PAS domain-containing protein [Brevundimonas sp.]
MNVSTLSSKRDAIGGTTLEALEAAAGGNHAFLRSVIDTTPECIKVVAPDGALLLMNHAGVDMVGGAAFEDVAGVCAFDLIAEGDRPLWLENHRRVCAGERLNWRFDIVGLNGRRRTMETRAAPIRLPGGEVGQLAITRDITGERRHEEALEESERRLRTILDAMPAAVYTTDRDGRITYYNRAAVEFSGRVPDLGSDSWCVSWKLAWPDGTPLPHDQCPMAMALRSRTPSLGQHEAVAERPDGLKRPFLPYATPLFDADGELVGGVNMLVDISERKRADERQQLLINELNHRVKNTLAVVQSLAHLTLRGETSPQALRAYEARLQSLAAAHDLLTVRSWRGAPLDDLILRVVAPHCSPEGRFDLQGPFVQLSPQTAVSLAMALHELCTNAVKYGALSIPEGRIRIAWTLAEDRLDLEWRERGGPPVTAPVRRGFGAQMLERALASEIGGRVSMEFRPEGLACRIEAPATGLEQAPRLAAE